MELSHEDVLEILQIIERSNVAYLELEIGETRIVADRSGHGPRGAQVSEPTVGGDGGPSPSTTEPVATRQAAPPPPAPPAAEPAVSLTPEPPDEDEDLVTVLAPVVGVFYRSSEPGAAPYIEVGTRIEAGATLGLVEVMKMFNSVTAEVAGEVVAILADNEEFVEFGSPLVTIRPEPSA